MRLFVLPPAFGLPSIDAECNAAIAFLQDRWRNDFDIIPSHHLNKRLPLLIDGQAEVAGFNSIVRHLTDKTHGDQGTQLGSKERADAFAITSFIESHAQTLIDISLYVSFENYRHTTRPAFTKVLPWYANYILPPQRRSAARSRTEHLGISSIDVDNVHEDMSNRPPGFDGVGKEQEFEAATQKRASLLLPRKETVMSLLKQPGHAAVFKLHALADNFFEALQDMLEKQEYLEGTDELQPVDCLTYGYLSLMLYPKVPQHWLASTMRRKYRKIATYVERIHQQLSLETDVDAVVALAGCKTHEELEARRTSARMSLRWCSPAETTAFDAMRYISRGIVDQIPIIRAPFAIELLHAPRRSFLRRHSSALLAIMIGSSAGLGYLALHTGLLVWPHGEQIQIFGKRRLTDYGHLGAALAGVSLLGSQPGQRV